MNAKEHVIYFYTASIPASCTHGFHGDPTKGDMHSYCLRLVVRAPSRRNMASFLLYLHVSLVAKRQVYHTLTMQTVAIPSLESESNHVHIRSISQPVLI